MTSTTTSDAPAAATNDALAVKCEGIEKSFRAGETRIKVLRGTDFTAEAGKMNFLVGPSGCGKTTLISIGAILSSENGQLNVLGTDLRKLSNGRLADFRLANLGFIFQQFNLLPALNAEENASLPLVAQGESTRKAERVARDLLERLGLEGQTKKLPAQLSGGQQQRVAIARALAHQPRLLICDEPTASLDAASGHTVMKLLRDVALEGDRSVIVVTHDNRIFEFADRISHMADGVITKTDTRPRTQPPPETTNERPIQTSHLVAAHHRRSDADCRHGFVIKNRPVTSDELPPRQPTTAPSAMEDSTANVDASVYIGAIGISEPRARRTTSLRTPRALSNVST